MTEKQRAAFIEKMRAFIINQETRIAWCPVPESEPSEILIMSAYAGYVVPGTLMEALPPEAHKNSTSVFRILPKSGYRFS